MPSEHQFNEGLLNFLHASPTPYHVVATLREALTQAGFQELFEAEPWPEPLIGLFFVVRNQSSLIAFNFNQGDQLTEQGLRLLGAHTDSPCLKLKPNAPMLQQGLLQLGVEVYGGALLHTWFDRDLSLAGRISYLDAQQQLQHSLIDFQHAIALIPSLAIHLNRDVNTSSSINAQQHLPPVVLQTSDSKRWDQLLRELLPPDAGDILSHDLFLYDTQAPAITGADEQFISSARLDNLISCYVGLMSLLKNRDTAAPSLLVCHDHEEVGSQSDHGAHGNFVGSILKRILGNEENYSRCLALSMMISMDNAHGLHPNYADKHDAQHRPLLNHGPVVKINANQRYATSGYSQAVIQWLAKACKVPLQPFVMRSDLACGSTIGPISAAQLGIKTVDVGVPQWAMHSIRETAGSKDAFALYQLVSAFLQVERLPENDFAAPL
jgi:aspartyl aminopeptidase